VLSALRSLILDRAHRYFHFRHANVIFRMRNLYYKPLLRRDATRLENDIPRNIRFTGSTLSANLARSAKSARERAARSMAFFLVARYQKKHSLCTGARETIFRAPTSRIPIPLLLLPPPRPPRTHRRARARAFLRTRKISSVSSR